MADPAPRYHGCPYARTGRHPGHSWQPGLRQLLEAQQAIAFAGAGVSAPLYPLWSGLPKSRASIEDEAYGLRTAGQRPPGLGKTALLGKWLWSGAHGRHGVFFWSFHRDTGTVRMQKALSEFVVPGETLAIAPPTSAAA